MTLFVIAGIYEGEDGARELINLDAVSTVTVVDKANNGYLVVFTNGLSKTYTLSVGAFRQLIIAEQGSLVDISG